MGRRYDVDWDAIERDYRLGQFTLRQIAKKHGVTAGGISRKAEKEKWVKDLSQQVKEKTQAALISNSTQINADAVHVAVQTNVALILEHRADIRESRALTKELLAELREAGESRAEIEDAVIDETSGDKNSKRRAIMLRAVALPSRAAVIGNLSSALKTLIGLERHAFNLDDPQGKSPDTADSPRDLSGLTDDDLDAVERIVRKVAVAGGNPSGEVAPNT